MLESFAVFTTVTGKLPTIWITSLCGVPVKLIRDCNTFSERIEHASRQDKIEWGFGFDFAWIVICLLNNNVHTYYYQLSRNKL